MIYIFDPDALDRMAELEGQEWKKHQVSNPSCPFGFFAYLEAWRFREQTLGFEDEPVCWLVDPEYLPFLKGRGDGAIYGNGGYTRYHVASNGQIYLDYSSTHSEIWPDKEKFNVT